jgi:hypothetical protein
MTFPSNGSAISKNGTAVPYSPLILVDLIDLPQSITYGQVVVDPTTGRISGSGTFGPSFGVGNYNLSFCADFSKATVRDVGVFRTTELFLIPRVSQKRQMASILRHFQRELGHSSKLQLITKFSLE